MLIALGNLSNLILNISWTSSCVNARPNTSLCFPSWNPSRLCHQNVRPRASLSGRCGLTRSCGNLGNLEVLGRPWKRRSETHWNFDSFSVTGYNSIQFNECSIIFSWFSWIFKLFQSNIYNKSYPLVINIAMENGPFIDGLPMEKNGDFPWLC